MFCGAEPPVRSLPIPASRAGSRPPGATLVRLASLREDALAALAALAEALGAPAEPALVQAPTSFPAEPGKLNSANLGAILAELLPENAIVSDEGATARRCLMLMCAGAAQHDWLQLTGGAIGQGLPLAVGAAVACPDRKVIALHGDGGAMYTCQALWTMAREQLDVTTDHPQQRLLRDPQHRADARRRAEPRAQGAGDARSEEPGD